MDVSEWMINRPPFLGKGLTGSSFNKFRMSGGGAGLAIVIPA